MGQRIGGGSRNVEILDGLSSSADRDIDESFIFFEWFRGLLSLLRVRGWTASIGTLCIGF